MDPDVSQSRTPRAHPDAQRITRRMPFGQLRALIVSLLDDTLGEDPGPPPPPAPLRTRATPRASTLDDLIASLRADRS